MKIMEWKFIQMSFVLTTPILELATIRSTANYAQVVGLSFAMSVKVAINIGIR